MNMSLIIHSEIRRRNERDLEQEREKLRKLHAEKLNQMNVDYEREKQTRKEKFMAQISKYITSVDNLDDFNDERKEIAVCVEFNYYLDFHIFRRFSKNWS